MIYTITLLDGYHYYIEKKTTDEHIITGWAIVTPTTEGVSYKDCSKVNKTFLNFAEMMNTFENCKTKEDEISEDESDYEFYDWIDFTKKFYKMTSEEVDVISTREETDARSEIESLKDRISDLEKEIKFYRDYSLGW